MKTIIRTTLAGLAGFFIVATAAHARPGDLDPTFGTGGKVTTDFGGFDTPSAVVPVPAEGKILVVGKTSSDIEFGNFALARYNADGTPDGTFGAGGRVTTNFGGQDEATCVAVRQLSVVIGGPPKIAIVAAGRASGGNFALARYDQNDGSLDTTFGGGKVITDLGGTEHVTRIAFQSTSPIFHKVVAAGSTDRDGTDDFALVRYNLDGSPDTTFGSGGVVVTDISGGDDFCLALAVQPDRKILAGGFAITPDRRLFVIARYDSSGSPDSTFGTLGKVVVSFPGAAGAICVDLAVLPDGKIVAAGGVFSQIPNVLAQLNPNGSLDPSFGVGGMVVTPAGPASLTQFSSMTIQPDGKILLSGNSFISPSSRFAIVRYKGNGAVDKSFGTGGRVITSIADSSSAAAAFIRGDGSIVAAGSASNAGNRDFALASLKTAQGDARVNLSGEIPRGDDRYNTTGAGQTQSVAIPRDGGVKNVLIGIQNDTAAIDSFTVRGTPGNSRFKVKYLHGSDNVTAQLLNGTLSTGSLAPGAIYKLKARITATTSVKGKTRDFSVTPTSAADPTAKDRVLIKARSK
ncbi:MAG: hypothetical protein V4819_18825 [Verrucomicrobiota bacterium]